MQILVRIVWLFRFVFMMSNWLQWYLMAPLQYLVPKAKTDWPYKYFLWATPLRVAYWVLVYIYSTPLRFINALYFDIILYWVVVMRDGTGDLFYPKLGRYRTLRGFKYLLYWLLLLPVRCVQIIFKYFGAFAQGVVMLVFDTIIPTITLYHGTTFEHSATKIAQTGVWYVGGGNFAGTGVYFGLSQKVATHYAQSAARASGGTPAVVVARVTMLFPRTVITLPAKLRIKVGRDGENLSRSIRFPWSVLVHWRTDGKWYEFCLVQPGKMGRFIKTWRVRPICVLKNGVPTRVWGGMSSITSNL